MTTQAQQTPQEALPGNCLVHRAGHTLTLEEINAGHTCLSAALRPEISFTFSRESRGGVRRVRPCTQEKEAHHLATTKKSVLTPLLGRQPALVRPDRAWASRGDVLKGSGSVVAASTQAGGHTALADLWW